MFSTTINRAPRTLLPLALAAASLVTALGCHAQLPAPGGSGALGQPLSPELARRVEILIRNKAKLPPSYTFVLGPRTKSEVPGYDEVDVTFANEGEKPSRPIPFLLSKDGNTVAQMTTYDISQNPVTLITAGDRPARGGPATAPVQVVGFDDLECPYCARLNAEIFPALTQRYGDKVRVVYRDFPISQHPWALRAAIDVNCVGQQSPAGYWALVDTIHAHASEYGGADHSLQKALDSLDQASIDEAKKENLKTAEVESCIKKQDQTAINASLKLGDTLGIEATPILFVNGERFEGAYPLQDLFRMVDQALIAEGQTPPPPYVPPAPPAAAPSTATPTTATPPVSPTAKAPATN